MSSSNLAAAVAGLTSGTLSSPTYPGVTINSTIGALLGGDTSGIALLVVGLTPVGGVGAVLSLLTGRADRFPRSGRR